MMLPLPTVLPYVGRVLVLAPAFGPHSQLEQNRERRQMHPSTASNDLPAPGLRWAVHKLNHLFS